MASESSSFSSAAAGLEQIDSPLMRSAGRELLSLALMDARNHTLRLFGEYQNALAAVNFRMLSSAGVSPPLWTLGHVGWFQEWWIGRNLQRGLGARCVRDPVRLASIEPDADRWWNPQSASHESRWDLALPDMQKCRAYLLETLESTLELLEKAGDDDESLYFYRLCLFYEDLRSEAMVHDAQALGLALDKPLRNAFTPPPMALREPMLIPATLWQMGSPGGPQAGFVFDNEQARHPVSVPEFEIDAQPVTWAQYVEFVGDGGYDREEFWDPAGLQWLRDQPEGRRGPRYVEQIGVASGAVAQTRFGSAMRMLGNQPAMHMSWWEADAWCRWAGRRLPAEVEWEVAAQSASRRGFRWGDVWEWTATTFRPYPGFAPGPHADYSEPWFGTHKVLRGGSFATRARLKHPKFRNFYLPGRDDVFCGFRSCAP